MDIQCPVYIYVQFDLCLAIVMTVVGGGKAFDLWTRKFLAT